MTTSSQTRASIQAHVFADQAALGQTYARVVYEYLRGSQSVVEAVARVPAVRAPLHPELVQPALHGIAEAADPERRASLESVLDGTGRVEGVVMAAANADVYLLEPYVVQTHFVLTNLNQQNPEILQHVVETGESTWSGVIPNRATNAPIVVLAVPIRDDAGVVEGMLGANLGLDGLADAARAVELDRTDDVTLFDSHGMPIVYPDASRVAARQPLTDILPSGRHGVLV